MGTLLRVLIVEDAEDDAMLLLRILRKGGYDPQYRRVDNGHDIQAALSEGEWDIVISDYSMPGFDGLSALRLCQGTGRDIPFILVSGTIGEEIAVSAMRAGAHDYLMKNNLTRLVPAVRRELQEAKIRRAHRQAEEALRASEEKYRLLVENAPSGIFEIDLEKVQFTSVNEVMCEYTGYTREEFLDLRPLDLLTRDNQSILLALLTSIRQGEAIPDSAEYKIRGKDGREFWVILRSRITGENDRRKVTVVAHDITERKTAEEALHRYAERLSTLHKIDQAILSARSVEEIAQAALDHIRQLIPCLAASVAMLEADSLNAILFVTDIDDQMEIQAGARFPLKQHEAALEVLNSLRQGEVVQLEDVPSLAQTWPELSKLADTEMHFASIVPLVFQDDLLGFISLGSAKPTAASSEQIEIVREIATQLAIAIQQTRLYDQVRRHAAELEERVEERTRELQLANENLKILSQVKDEFVSNVSHELRTPITSIKLYHRLLSLKPEKGQRYLDMLAREIDRLSHLIEDLLLLSRLDQDRAELKLAPVDLNELGSQYVEDRKLLAQERELTLSFTAGAGRSVVMADKGLLGQALSVLLTNAMSYTPEGGSVGVTVSGDDGQCGISVWDNGPGIDPEEQDRLFERFFRGKAGRKSGVAGTGLGLSLAAEIVERHQGKLELNSTGVPGEGAEFTIWLPACLNGVTNDGR
ncbi:MAG: PAS domain S-box protein [Anaerolineae bacterium]|nr:PAS domain S-box protein [Anaerolineae bacterium]